MRPAAGHLDTAGVTVWPFVALIATVFATMFVAVPADRPATGTVPAGITTPVRAATAGSATVVQLTVDGPLTPRMVAPTGLDDGLAGITAGLTIGPMNDGAGGTITAACTATPLAGTSLVVTAAHCMVHADRRTHVSVDFAGRSWDGRVVTVNPVWHENAADDVAVISVDSLPSGDGTLLRIGDVGGAHLAGTDVLPGGPLVVIGRQLVADDGTVIDPLADPEAATAATERPAACTVAHAQVTVTGDGSLDVPCGLLPGASGGPALAHSTGGWVLVGVVSSLVRERWANQLSSLTAIRTVVADAVGGDSAGEHVVLAR